MTNTYGSILMAILLASSACLASAQSQSSVAIITGEVRDPTAREITFRYQPPSAIGSGEERVVLDSLNRFACELPVVRGALVRAYCEDGRSMFFVEPGDSLHIVVEGGMYSFSGPNADNNRFFAELFPRLRGTRLDYEGLKVEDFSRQADQWLQDELEFLAEGRKKYALSPRFIDYATTYFNYLWARLMISYPMEYRRANGHENREITPEYYDFLKEIPLVNEKAIGVGNYRVFLDRTLGWELDKAPRSSALSSICALLGLELSEETEAQFDSLYEKGRRPKLSKMVDLSAVGLSSVSQAELDFLYEKKKVLKLSQMFDLSALGLSQTAQAELDSFFEKSGRSYSITSSGEEEVARVDTTGGALVFRLPAGLPINEQMESFSRTLKLSEMVDLSAVGLSPASQAQLDSLYEHRQPLRLSAKVDLSGLGLSAAVQAQLDSIYATGRWTVWHLPKKYKLAKKKLEGRVLYWYLAEELIHSFKRGSEVFELTYRKWEDFQQSNPYPEYTEAVQAVLYEVLKLQSGHPAPEFTLHDLDGQLVSLSQFKGQVVLLDFWASWCGPCIVDLPDLRKIKKKTAALPVVVLNLSLDEDEAAWREAIDKHEIEGVHVRADGFGSDLAKSYQVNALPSYYLVDSQGLIVERLSGVRDTDEIVATIEKSL